MTRETPQQSEVRNARRKGRGPTIADVARLAGVSPMTVSRVVNGQASVLPQTRETVEEAIRKLGYVPNLAARSLAGGRQFRIALLYANPSAAWLSEFLVGALAEASAADAQLLVEQWVEGEASDVTIKRLMDHRIDAVLLPPPLADNAALISDLRGAGLPVAQVAAGAPSDLAHAVTIDDEAAAHAVTTRLIAWGHRRIGFIAGSPDQTASALRQAGYVRALGEAGITANADWVMQGDFTFRSGLAAGLHLLGQPSRPTAVFASNDDMAAGAVAAAHRLRLEIPAHVSICGFDDTAIATATWPELTTVRQPVADMARRATRLLVEALDGVAPKGSPRHLRLEFALVGRGSDGPPLDS